jgi:hypothetical protein
MGPAYPTETFRVLKENEIAQFGEYQTQRLVLQAWDKLEGGCVSKGVEMLVVHSSLAPKQAVCMS